MNSIYEMLNDVEVDLSEYKVYDLNDIEKKKLKSGIRKKLKKRPFITKRKVVTVAAVLSIALITIFMGNGVLANINLIRSSIEEFFHYSSSSLDEYKTIVNKEVTRNGVTVKLNEVLLDDDQIVISSTFNSDKIKWVPSTTVDVEIYINGKEIMRNGGGGFSEAKVINETTCSILTGRIPNDSKLLNQNGNLNIMVVFREIRTKNEKIKGKWVFQFTSSKDKLSAKIKTIPINNTITIDNGPKLTIESLRISPIATRLIYTQTEENRYTISFIINDQNGNEVKWVSGHKNWVSVAGNNNGIDTQIYDALDESVTKIKITPFLQAFSQPKEGNGEETMEYQKVMEEQAIEVNIH